MQIPRQCLPFTIQYPVSMNINDIILMKEMNIVHTFSIKLKITRNFGTILLKSENNEKIYFWGLVLLYSKFHVSLL